MDVQGVIPVVEAIPGPGDFMQDGLLYCGKCGTARQLRIEIFGALRTVTCHCECRSEKYNRECEEFRKQQELEQIYRLKTTALKDRTYRAWTFDVDDGQEPKMEFIRRYAENWDAVKSGNNGLLLWGDVGTGKSFAAACVVNELTGRGIPCMMTTFIKIANELSGDARYSKNEFIASLNRYQLLAIDDLGAERETETVQEMVFDVIDARYRAGLPLIVTTNIPYDKIKNPDSVTRGRIYDRILEMTTPVKFTVKRRMQAHREKRKDLIAMFEGERGIGQGA